MSAFRELIDAIQDEPLWAPPRIAEPAPRRQTSIEFNIMTQAHDERWDRRKLKRMMRRAAEGKST